MEVQKKSRRRGGRQKERWGRTERWRDLTLKCGSEDGLFLVGHLWFFLKFCLVVVSLQPVLNYLETVPVSLQPVLNYLETVPILNLAVSMCCCLPCSSVSWK